MELSVNSGFTCNLSREQSRHKVLRQVGWLDETGRVYDMLQVPLAPNVLTPLYISIGTWTQDEGNWVVKD